MPKPGHRDVAWITLPATIAHHPVAPCAGPAAPTAAAFSKERRSSAGGYLQMPAPGRSCPSVIHAKVVSPVPRTDETASGLVLDRIFQGEPHTLRLKKL
jgi:hypothetical protein